MVDARFLVSQKSQIFDGCLKQHKSRHQRRMKHVSNEDSHLCVRAHGRAHKKGPVQNLTGPDGVAERDSVIHIQIFVMDSLKHYY